MMINTHTYIHHLSKTTVPDLGLAHIIQLAWKDSAEASMVLALPPEHLKADFYLAGHRKRRTKAQSSKEI